MEQTVKFDKARDSFARKIFLLALGTDIAVCSMKPIDVDQFLSLLSAPLEFKIYTDLCDRKAYI